ncbi:hypothetical protein KL918_003423 [Ogataea parapolymorpha]|uniref:Rho-type GTPase-activating protein 1 n=1 Tax=Ogataea parapolymorpha (strain ATCC 26012 / BCRC 20466 / JCM 22074 / NRRL Y-7560 / DL-1) TaxID=871575 RepID=W1Q7I6_OGAPD|nr:Rho-type GTPase-activating protein 1 [Ogataea parapolymorpha DL-1]ESW95866.1 Rho-type GTPase-activating protein 1 [Ogataea parapolymorpha DL-1]KAG7866526.1 hypothetical protein KL918_003423 [Ogataea parapolymorpha]KAG7872538.1 hypothetical protein KL916_002933 [Ogataea parapolymorpha]
MDNTNKCKNCQSSITEGQAYELGGERWHIECFRCSKCDKELGVNSNFLMLGTGSLVCSECSYSCKSCGKKIYDMAILTGDQAYCANCFKCKACKRPIEDLRYARTSKGLFCMPCHHKLVERKRKYEAVKSRNFGSSLEPHSSADTVPSDEKRQIYDDLADSKPLSATEKVQVTSPPKVTKSPVLQKVEGSPVTIQRESQEELLTIPLRSPNRNLRSPNIQPVAAFTSPKVDDFAEINMMTPTPLKADRSPITLTGVVSPGNRNAFIFEQEPEPESFVDLSDDDDDTDESDEPPKEVPNPMRSPSKKPPSGTIPHTPERQSSSPYKGLNISGLQLADDDQRQQEPAVEVSRDKENTGFHSRKSSGGFSRSLSIKNVFHRHKKSNSGAGLEKAKTQALRDASSPPMDQEELLKTPDFGSPMLSHKRTQSDLTTNPFSLHLRSRSDVVYEENQPESQILQVDKQLKQLKSELVSLTSAKANLMRDIQSLTAEKSGLEEDIAVLREQKEKLETDTVAESKETESSDSPSFAQSDDTLPQLPSKIALQSRKMSSTEELGDKPRKGGFIRRIFGANGTQTSQQNNYVIGSPSVQDIGSPKNFRQMDDSFNTSQEDIEESKPVSGLSAMIKSRSSNFLRGNAYPLGKSLYQCTLQERAELELRTVPFVFSCCLSEIEARGIREGIYRVSGSSLAIDKIEKYFETVEVSNEKDVSKAPSVLEGDINAVAGMLKRYLKKIPDPVIPFRNYEQFIEISKIQNEAGRFAGLKTLLNDLPEANFVVLLQLAKHMGVVARNSNITKMTYSSLATVFAPTLARDNTFNPQREILDNGAKTAVTEFLFRNHEDLFRRAVA